jgi:hypothetical protein
MPAVDFVSLVVPAVILVTTYAGSLIAVGRVLAVGDSTYSWGLVVFFREDLDIVDDCPVFFLS